MHNGKQKSIISLKKSKTSVEKIIEMVEKDIDCSSIIQQNLSVIGLIKSANINLLEAFIDNCSDKEDSREKILHIFKLLQK